MLEAGGMSMSPFLLADVFLQDWTWPCNMSHNPLSF